MYEPLSKLLKPLSCERGQATVMVALSLLLLLGFLGLTVDVGLLFHAKRAMQTAADAAAIAGAAEVPSDTAPNWTLVTRDARAASAANGYTHGSNGVTVDVHTPASTGSHLGAETVEVVVSQPQSTSLMALLGFTSMNVNARAVAQKGYPSKACLSVLDPSAPAALQLQGNFDVNAPACGVVVNSKDPDAIDLTGNKGTLTASSVGVVGGCQSNPSSACTGNINPSPVQSAPTSDPLYFLPDIPDNPPGCAAASGSLTPGSCYSGNVTINGTLSPGTYTFTGNVSLGTVTGNGVTFLLSKNATFNVDVGTVTLSPPTSGTYKGVLLYASRDNTSQIQLQKGSSSGSFSGIIYAPSAQLYLQDSGGGISLNSDLIVGTLFDKASTMNLTSYTQTNPTNSPLTQVVLVE